MILPAKPFKLRFSIRAILVMMTLLAIWCGYSMNWIRQRREIIESSMAPPLTTGNDVTAPSLLWMFGEPGYHGILIARQKDDAEVARVSSLFPEAKCEGWTESSGR